MRDEEGSIGFLWILLVKSIAYTYSNHVRLLVGGKDLERHERLKKVNTSINNKKALKLSTKLKG